MKTWSKPPAGNISTTPSGASNLNDLSDVTISGPQAGQIITHDGTQFTNGPNNIDAGQIISGTINLARLPNLTEISLTGDALPPYISSITPITPSGEQEIEILGEYFSPITQLNIPGVDVVNLEVRSPSRIIATINKNELTGNIPLHLSNGIGTNSLWADSIKDFDVFIDPNLYPLLFLKGEGINNSSLFLDSSPNPVSLSGSSGAKISTDQKKYGASSIYLDGASSIAGAFALANSINIRTDPFTIEGWFYPLSNTFFSLFTSAGGFYPFLGHSGIIYTGDGTTNIISISGQNPPLNTWTHFALSFDGTTYRMYRNKNQIASSPTLLKNHTIENFTVGARLSTSHFFHGYIDGFQIIKRCRLPTELDAYLNQ